MAPIILRALTAALLLIGGIDAFPHDGIQYSQWGNDNCTGHVSTYMAIAILGFCHPMDAYSIKLHLSDNIVRNGKWLHDVSRAYSRCWATIYHNDYCREGASITYELPVHLETCLQPGFMRSIRFNCGPYQTGTSLTETTTRFNYFVDQNNRFHSMAATFTESHYPDKRAESTQVLDAKPTEALGPEHHLDQWVEPTETLDFESTKAHHLQSRGQGHRRAHWYKHPWAGSDLCFYCWLTRKKHEDRFECYSNSKTEHGCDHIPVHGTVTHKSTRYTTHVTTVPLPLAGAYRTSIIHSPPPRLENRSSRSKLVRIPHPFHGGVEETCAKAKWKHEGDVFAQVITLKGPKRCKDGDDFHHNVGEENTHVTNTAVATVTKTRYVVANPGATSGYSHIFDKI